MYFLLKWDSDFHSWLEQNLRKLIRINLPWKSEKTNELYNKKHISKLLLTLNKILKNIKLYNPQHNTHFKFKKTFQIV